MRVTAKNGTLIGAEGETPPLPFIEVEAEEAEALIARGLAKEYVEGEEPVDVVDLSLTPTEPEPVVEPEPEPEIVPEPAADAVAEPVEKSDLMEAFELLDEDDFVKTGPRAGKPKVAPLAAVLGREVTAEEVDAAFESKDAAPE